MPDIDAELTAFHPGYATPPLSPAKTVSTSGWDSPRTPGSPRKTQSCLFIRSLDDDADALLPSLPKSPTKSTLRSRFSALSSPEILKASHEFSSPKTNNDSLAKKKLDILPRPSLRTVVKFTRSNNRNSIQHEPVLTSISQYPSDSKHPNQPKNATSIVEPEHGNRESSRTLSTQRLSSVPLTPPLAAAKLDSETPKPLKADPSSDECLLLDKLYRLSPRQVGSPLRPSQWVARGGHLSLPSRRQLQSRNPDRFIPSPRPPNLKRESFELGKPVERLVARHRVSRGGTLVSNPFSPHVRRSARLNSELQSLREMHSVIAGRINPGQRGAPLNLGRSPLALGIRQVSARAVWNVGGTSAVSDTVVGVSDGRGGTLGSGTNAALHTSSFLNRADPEAELEAYERRLALALDVDQTDRILCHSALPSSSSLSNSSNTPPATDHRKHVWKDNAWVRECVITILDAPQLRDDYYCSLLAYSSTAKCLAVGLGNFVHIWSERDGVDTPESLNSLSGSTTSVVQHVTSLAFSSTQGGQAILAVGRADGRIALWSPFDSEPRFDAIQPKPISCISFRPTPVPRPSLRDRALTVPTEELLIGDEVGHIYVYSVEWPSEMQSALFGWNGAMTLLARMAIHSQQICGLAWSPDGDFFATGGNDNNCFLFETKRIFQSNANTATETSRTPTMRQGPDGEVIYNVADNRPGSVVHIPQSAVRHKWTLNAAVKAIAFCPWQRGLIAIGGGSNDRCIHFYHTRSGTCLATIDCAAQVTSLIWSQTRKEIVATFGFAQPEHPYRIAVFAWPTCEQVVAIPWWDENRALCAIAYPGGPSSEFCASNAHDSGRGREGESVWSSSVEEGCIIVAASDMAIRFHEIWTDGRGSSTAPTISGGGVGLLGGSDILEGLHGIEREGDAVLR